MLPFAALAVALALLSCSTASRQDRPASEAPARALELGAPIRDRLAPSIGSEFRVRSEVDAVWTIGAESLDFDPELEVVDDTGTTVTRDSDSGPYWNPRLSVALKAGEELRVRLRSRDTRGGAFKLEAVRSSSSTAQAADGSKEDLRFFDSASHALASSDPERSRSFLRMGAELAFELDDRSGASERFAELLSRAQEGRDHALEARCLARLAALANREGAAERALELASRAEAAATTDGTASVRMLLLLECARADLELGRSDVALARAEQALPLDVSPEDELEGARAFASIAERCVQRNELARARAFFDRARELGLRSTAEEASDVLLRAGEFFYDAADLELAEACFRGGLEHHPGPGSAFALQGYLANVLMDRGRFREARTLLEDLRSKDAAPAGSSNARALETSFASLAFKTGDLDEVIRICEHELAAIPSEKSAARVAPLQNLALALELGGEFPRAVHAYEEALAACDRSADGVNYGDLLVNSGRAIRLSGQLEEAEDRQNRAVEWARQIGNTELESAALDGLANVRLDRGRGQDARELAERAAELARAKGLNEVELYPLQTIARAALAQRDADGAGAALARAEELLDDPVLGPSASADASGFRSRFASWGELAQDRVSLRLEDGRVATATIVREGLADAGRWKGRALLEGIQSRRAKSGDLGEANRSPDELLAALDTALGPRRALIEYAAGSRQLFAYVLAGGELRFVDLGQRASIEQHAARYARSISGADGLELDPRELLKQGRALYDELVAPIVAHLPEGTLELALVPTPELAEVSFDGIAIGAPSTSPDTLGFRELEYLGDRFTIVYEPSSPLLAELHAIGPRAQPGRMLFLGDPLYASELPAEARNEASEDPARRWHRLAASGDEVYDIASEVLDALGPGGADLSSALKRAKKERGSLSTPRFDFFLGREASASSLSRAPEQYALLHLAVHGYVDARDPRRSGLVLSFEPSKGGMFELADVLALHLDADLVVLTACDTARGPVLRGEGVQSVAQAFLQAGARAVVATLWTVEDDKSRLAMAGFYRSCIEDGSDPASALARARHELRMSSGDRGVSPSSSSPLKLSSSHPYFWAPFVYIGRVR